jgi:hypothetical protein
MNIRSLPCLGSDCKEHHVTRRQEPSETALTVHRDLMLAIMRRPAPTDFLKVSWALTQGCHHQAVKTFQRLRLWNDMIFVDVPKCRHRVCSQCGNCNLKMRIFPAGRDRSGRQEDTPPLLLYRRGEGTRNSFLSGSVGFRCLTFPGVRRGLISAGDVIVEQVSAHFGRFAAVLERPRCVAFPSTFGNE